VRYIEIPALITVTVSKQTIKYRIFPAIVLLDTVAYVLGGN